MFILKKFKKLIILFVILIGLVYFINKVFIDCEKINTILDREFTLEKMDYASVDDSDETLIVKLWDIKDERCKNEDCNKNNDLEAKLVVLNGKHLSYITLSENTERSIKITKKKMEYNIELVSITEDGKVTLRVTK